MSVAGVLVVWAAASVPAALVVGALVVGALMRAGNGPDREPSPALRELSDAFTVPDLSRATLDAHPAQRAAQVGLDEARERELGEFQAETTRLRTAQSFDQCGVCASLDGHLPDCPAAGA